MKQPQLSIHQIAPHQILEFSILNLENFQAFSPSPIVKNFAPSEFIRKCEEVFTMFQFQLRMYFSNQYWHKCKRTQGTLEVRSK